MLLTVDRRIFEFDDTRCQIMVIAEGHIHFATPDIFLQSGIVDKRIAVSLGLLNTIITIDFLLKDLEFEEHSFQFKLPVDKIQNIYCEDSRDNDDYDPEEMLEKDGLEYISFEKRYF